MTLASVLNSIRYYTDEASVQSLDQSQVIATAAKLDAAQIGRIEQFVTRMYNSGDTIVQGFLEDLANRSLLNFADHPGPLTIPGVGTGQAPGTINGVVYLNFENMDNFYGLTRWGSYEKIDPVILFAHELAHNNGGDDPTVASPWDDIQNQPDFDYYGGSGISESATRFEHYVADALGLFSQNRAGYIPAWTSDSVYHDYFDQGVDYIGYAQGRVVDVVRLGQIQEGFLSDNFAYDYIRTDEQGLQRDLVFGFGSRASFNDDDIATGAGDDVIYGGETADRIDAGADDDWVFAGGGDDVIVGGLGIDLIDADSDYSPAGSQFGTGGNDTLTYAAADFHVAISFGSAAIPSSDRSALTINNLTGDSGTNDLMGVGVDTVNGVETVIGSDFADVITLGAGLTGDYRGVLIDLGGSGRERPIDGRTRVDTINAEDFTGTLTFDLSDTDLQTVTGGSFQANFANVEAAVGGAGSDTFYGSASNNIFNGSGGFDTVDYSRGTRPIQIQYEEEDGVAEIAVRDGQGGIDRLESIEIIVGTSGFDLLAILDPITTTSLTIDGGGGQVDGPREDIINGSGSTEGLIVNIDQSGNGFVSNGGGGHINLRNFSTQIVTSAHDDEITDFSPGNKRIGGGTGDDVISTAGSTGDVMLIGGDGNDTLTGGSGNDVIIGGSSNDTRTSQQNQLFGGAGDDYLLSTSLYDDLYGGEGNDFIEVNYEVDRVINTFTTRAFVSGGAGDDYIRYVGTNATIDIGFGQGDGADTVELAAPDETSALGYSFTTAGVNLIMAGLTKDDITIIIDQDATDLDPNPDQALFSTLTDIVIIINATGDSIYLNDRYVFWYPDDGGNGTIWRTTINSDGNTISDVPITQGDISQYRGSPSTFFDNTAPDPEDTQGGDGDDHLEGGLGDDDISGGDGDDTISTSGGNDTVDGGAGNDTLYVFGSRADFTATGSAASVVLTDQNGIEGQVTLTSVENIFFVTDGESYTVEDLLGYFGTAADDEIKASDRDNEIFGLEGNDTIDALGGDDLITGGAGNDIIDGGEGYDTVFLSGARSDYLVERFADGRVEIQTLTAGIDDGNDTLQNVERIFFSTGNFVLDPSTLPLLGTDGDDIMVGTQNDDELSGLAGNDQIFGEAGYDLIDGGIGDDFIDGGDGDDELLGGDGHDEIHGGAGNDEIDGGSGNDTISAGSGANDVYGGAGDDVINGGDFETIYDLDILNGGSGEQSYDYISGGDGNDTIFGNAGDDEIFGNDGDDILNPGAGDDYVDGGEGIDTAEFSSSISNYEITRNHNGTVIVTDMLGGGMDELANIEFLTFTGNGMEESVTLAVSDIPITGLNVIRGDNGDNVLSGTDDDDALIGREGNDSLNGGLGNDRLVGGVGADTMTGGFGDDTYLVDDAGDTVTEATNEGTDRVVSTISYVLGDNVENLTLNGLDPIDGTGNALDNRIVGRDGVNVLLGLAGDDVLVGGAGDDTLGGGEGNDRLVGGIGADSMTGGLGDDTYLVDDLGDTVTEGVDEGSDTVVSSVDFTLGDHLENLTLTGSGSINGTGNSLANRIVGNDGVNSLQGMAGDDVIVGGVSNDILDGGEGNDRLNGGLGADTMVGGLGDDIYLVDDAGDIVTEAANEGADRVVSTISFVLADNVENLTLNGPDAIDGTGNALANRIVGRDGANVLLGLAGDDVLVGGAGDDTLEGGEGNDRLVGGTGYDTAVFAGERSTYSIVTSGGAITVRDDSAAIDGDDGADRISSVELLSFGDGQTISIAAPIILDLAGDGIELVNAANSDALFDLDDDGLADDTSWIGSGEAFLYLDRNGDGTMSDASEISFIDDVEEAASDLAGLRAFDSNGDGLLTAEDERFEEFGVWRDANSDGVVDDGEIFSLTDVGIASFDLGGTAVEGTTQFGDVAVVNTGSFTLNNGEAREFADAALTYFSTADGLRQLEVNRTLLDPNLPLSRTFELTEGAHDIAPMPLWALDYANRMHYGFAVEGMADRLRFDPNDQWIDLFEALDSRSAEQADLPRPPMQARQTVMTESEHAGLAASFHSGWDSTTGLEDFFVDPLVALGSLQAVGFVGSEEHDIVRLQEVYSSLIDSAGSLNADDQIQYTDSEVQQSLVNTGMPEQTDVFQSDLWIGNHFEPHALEVELVQSVEVFA